MNKPHLSQVYTLEKVRSVLEHAAANCEWGRIEVSFQAGVIKTIRKEETIIDERAHGRTESKEIE
jgi:hypothetical protein